MSTRVLIVAALMTVAFPGSAHAALFEGRLSRETAVLLAAAGATVTALPDGRAAVRTSMTDAQLHKVAPDASLVHALPVQAADGVRMTAQFAEWDRLTAITPLWRVTRGEGVTVAVLDSGVDLAHPALHDRLWVNPGETAANGVDDDGNGHVDDVHGATFIAPGLQDANGHGTHVSGIIAAQPSSDRSVVGVAPDVRIMVVRVLDDQGAGSTAGLAEGIRYAVNNGARILNVSINGDGSTPDLDSAVAYAEQHGAVIVASAGNQGRDLEQFPSFPAASPSPAVLTTAATDDQGLGLSAFSNWGVTAVDVAAPGEQVLSSELGGRFGYRSGTSMAAPFVSASLALVVASTGRPTSEARQLLINAALRRPGFERVASSGVVSPTRAARLGGLTIPAALPGRFVAVRRSVTKGVMRVTWRLTVTGVSRVRVRLSGRTVRARTVAGDVDVVRFGGLPRGRYRVSLSAYDRYGMLVARRALKLR